MNKRKRESSQNHDDESEMNDDTLLKHTISEEAKKSYGWTYSKRDLNDADGYDWREKVLMIGCELGHLHVIYLLVRNGVDVNAVDEVKRTALHIAANFGRAGIVSVLLRNGADVNAVDEWNKTALHLAAHKGHVDVAKVLIQNGADVNAVGEYQWTALHWAADEGHVNVVQVLLQNGADVNAVGEYQWTALHWAVCRNTVRNVRCTLQLLCFGAEINEKTIKADRRGFLRPIYDRLTSLRKGTGMETTLMSDEERRFMWNLAFSFTIQHRGAAFKAYYAIRSFITFHGIFMAPGYNLGESSVWNEKKSSIGIIRHPSGAIELFGRE